MIVTNKGRRTLRNLSAAAFIAGLSAFASTAAFANGCPVNQMGDNPLTNAQTKPVGVTDTVLEQIDLSKEMVKLADHKFRIRELVIQPGGVVPLHDHGDRPALIYIVSGEINEYAIEIMATANQFKRGHRICVEITSLDVATGVGGATNVEYIPYHICSSKTVLHRIYHDPRHPSHLLLPVIANA